MADITIEKAQRLTNKAATDILAILACLEQDTGLHVNNVNLDRAFQMGKANGTLFAVSLDITVPAVGYRDVAG